VQTGYEFIAVFFQGKRRSTRLSASQQQENYSKMPMPTLEPEVKVASTPEPVDLAAPTKWLQYTRAFAGLFLRDLHVLRREKISFLIRVCMNPLLFLFVFTYIMPHMSGGAALNPTAQMAGANFSTVLLPGLMAVAIMFSGIAAVALPLAQEFGITREIDDRVMCPLPVAAVAIEKIVYAHVNSWPFLIAVVTLASLTAGALGLVIGTSVKPQQISLIFGTVVMPITFLGCVYYPWAKLDTMPILQHAVLINPIVYMSEGLRAALTPGIDHMNPLLILTMLTFSLVLLTWFGIRGFLHRVIG
jgi:ABC-2 type transport system permease protein